ncbi:MAG: error-prone DNA polymerase [Microthrixaceae bacterium]
MGWRNPAKSWSELEAQLSAVSASPGRAGHPADPPKPGPDGPATQGNDHEPRQRTRPAGRRRRGAASAELHAHSYFSFLDGASSPEDLVYEAAALELDALALTDHNGFYGVVRFAEAAREVGLPTVFGAEVSIGAGEPRAGEGTSADPSARHLVILARGPEGYARLGTLLSKAQMSGEKGRPALSFAELAEAAGRARGHWAALTGCRKGTVPAALMADGPAAGARELRALTASFGADSVFVELWDHGDPLDSARNDALVRLAAGAGVQPLATNNVHYATAERRRLAGAMAAIRARSSLDGIDGHLPANGGAHLRSGAEQRRRFARYPGVVDAAAALGVECAFDLALVAPALPPYPCPAGADGAPMSEMAFLRTLTEEGAVRRYGTRSAETAPGAWAQIDHELATIESLGFAGYFLVVWDIVEFCRRSDIFCQGRGSAANSAVCFALGVTKADSVRLGLLFERFLSPERDGPPDIDLDIESGRREEVIQYVYERHGRTHAAQVANVITYRGRSSVRDAAKALGYSVGQQDAWSKELGQWGPAPAPGEGRPEGVSAPDAVLELAGQLQGAPRHLGIHSGGMVMCDRPVVEVCPTEWGRMENRSVLQWDKDDCAAAGLVKFDLLGLGMLTALHAAVDHVAAARGEAIDLATIPQDDDVYDMLCRGDSVGVFQVESRAQMATLPRLQPRCFSDLVVEVALIRPGPIQGGSVHPYLRRRRGEEPVSYLHPLCEPALRKTLGVPLFQEQLMQLAIDVAGFTPTESDQLRQAMAAKRSERAMAALARRFAEGTAANGLDEATSEELWSKLAAFSNYGFPESHSVSFAYLVYASAWLKYHEPAAFLAGLLNAQPMGFWSPHSLTQDARRHGVAVDPPDVAASAALSSLWWPDGEVPDGEVPDGESTGSEAAGSGGPGGSDVRPPDTEPWPDKRYRWNRHRPQPRVRLGLSSVRHLGEDAAEAVVAGRPYASVEDLARRAGLTSNQLEALATAGALGCFEDAQRGGQPMERRAALWAVGAAAQSSPDRLAGVVTGADAPRLPGMAEWEEAQADLWATGVSATGHPTRFVRHRLDALGVVTTEALTTLPDGAKVAVGGMVTHRQRPQTAGGTIFFNLEDETGLVNVVCSPGCWVRYRRLARDAPALVVRGRLERTVDDVVAVAAERFDPLPVPMGAHPTGTRPGHNGRGGRRQVGLASRDFR